MTKTDPFDPGLSAVPRPAGRHPAADAAPQGFPAFCRSLCDLYDLRDLPDPAGLSDPPELSLHPESLSRAARPILLALIETVLAGHAEGSLIQADALLPFCEQGIALGGAKTMDRTRENGKLMEPREARAARKPTAEAAPWAGLLAFNALEAFSRPPRRALDEERRVLAAFPANTQEHLPKQLERKKHQDGKLLEFFLKKQGRAAGTFTEMDPAARRGYFWLWSQSGFALKRRFHRSCRDAVLAAAGLRA